MKTLACFSLQRVTLQVSIQDYIIYHSCFKKQYVLESPDVPFFGDVTLVEDESFVLLAVLGGLIWDVLLAPGDGAVVGRLVAATQTTSY